MVFQRSLTAFKILFEGMNTIFILEKAFQNGNSKNGSHFVQEPMSGHFCPGASELYLDHSI